VQNPVAIRVLEVEFSEGDTVVLDREPGTHGLVFRSADVAAGAGAG
jgi:hypothetical protein